MTLFWVGFSLFIITMLALDLGIFHKKPRPIPFKEAILWTSLWVSLASLFGVGIYGLLGAHKALEFFTGYLLELSLSLDNVFVFILIFSGFNIPSQYQYRVLYWGVLGALIMRLIMILLGIELIERFAWIIYVFGAFILISGIKMLFTDTKETNLDDNKIVKFLKKHLPITNTIDGQKFIITEKGKRFLTPLGLALIFAEISDLMFALDSIPAIFAVTTDPFIVYTSNCFAILGLRALYFALRNMMEKFYYLHHGLALLLIVVGIKMLLAHTFPIPTWATLFAIMLILSGAVIASLIKMNKQDAR